MTYPTAMQMRFVIPPANVPGADKQLSDALAAAKAAGNDFQFKVLETVQTARRIATPGKGILAADESTGTIQTRFANLGKDDQGNPVPELDANGRFTDDVNEPAHHQKYRELLFTTPEMQKYISGVIMFEETLTDGRVENDVKVDHGDGTFIDVAKGTSFSELLQKRGIIPGIKVDGGAKQDLPHVPGAPYTKGLDSLPAKCQQAYALGARFAKWRATIKIIDGFMSQAAIQETAWTLARYAAICQVNGLAPIVEPEVLMDGEHSLALDQYWTEKVVSACYKALIDQEVVLEGTLLKPNMVLPGQDSEEQGRALEGEDAAARDKEFALATVTALKRTVPPAVPGIVFLSGGQTEEQATRRLNFINQLGSLPWSATFSYGRALQQSALQTWQGKPENKKAAQEQYLIRAKANGAAQLGKYGGEAAKTKAAHYDAYVKGYVY